MNEKRYHLLAVHRYLFFQLADYIYDYPNYSSWITVGVCVFLSLGLHSFNFNDSFRDGYFLRDSKSVEEHKTFLQFYNYSKMPYMLAIFGECTTWNCSMLEKKYFIEMQNEVTLGLRSVLPPLDFYEIYPRTLKNFLIYSSETEFTFLERYAKPSNSSKLAVEYPYLLNGSEQMPVQHVVYGATKGNVFALRFLMAFNVSNPVISNMIRAAELHWYQKLKARVNQNVKLYILGDELVDYEIQNASHSAVQYFVIGAFLMIAVIYRIIWQYEQERKVNTYLTFLTVLCPSLAVAATFGIFSSLSIPINSTMMITPFLVLSVGVDDAFLLMHSWFYSKSTGSARFCLMYTTVGPSILLSSATNVAAFLIGYLMSPSADTARFCLTTAVAFAVCWVLEMFVLAPQLLLSPGKVPPNNRDGFHVSKQHFEVYSVFLQKFSFFHVGALLLTLALHAVCILAVMNMKENFAPEKTFDGDSFLAKSLALLNRIYSDHQMIRIISPQLPWNATVLRDDVARIKSFPYLCDNHTTWLDRYEQLYRPTSTDIQKYFSQLPNFIKQFPETALFVSYNHKRHGLSLNKISLELCLRGFKEWRDRAIAANSFREMLPNGYSMFFYDSHIFDLILSIKETILNAVLLTVAVMVVICLFFLPTIRIAICTIISLFSIIIFVIGGLCMSGADLDVVLMVNVVMATGFTVDYVSHISYSLFLKAENTMANPTGRMVKALRAVCGPTAQAAITTVVCVAPLMFHNVYMYVTFAKTVVMCSVFGFIHAIFVMPFLISLTEIVAPLRPEEFDIHPAVMFMNTSFANPSNIPENDNNLFSVSSVVSSSRCYVSSV